MIQRYVAVDLNCYEPSYEGSVVLYTDHLAALEASVANGDKIMAELKLAVEKCVELEATVKEKDKEITERGKRVRVLEERIATLTKNRDECAEVFKIDRLHSTGGAEGKQWGECGCPSCFLHICYQNKIAALTEELRLSGLRGDSLDRIISEDTEREVALTAELKSLTKAYNNTDWKKKCDEQKAIINDLTVRWGKVLRLSAKQAEEIEGLRNKIGEVRRGISGRSFMEHRAYMPHEGGQ